MQHSELGQHPNILMVFEVGTASLMAAKGAYVPMYQLMKDAGQKFNPKWICISCKWLLHYYRWQNVIYAIQLFNTSSMG